MAFGKQQMGIIDPDETEMAKAIIVFQRELQADTPAKALGLNKQSFKGVRMESATSVLVHRVSDTMEIAWCQRSLKQKIVFQLFVKKFHKKKKTMMTWGGIATKKVGAQEGQMFSEVSISPS